MDPRVVRGNPARTNPGQAAGYSKRPLIEKLGLKSDMRAVFLNAPRNYIKSLGALPSNVTVMKRLSYPLNFIQVFVTMRKDLEKQIPCLKNSLDKEGMLWISWPKSSSGKSTDIKEDTIRDTALPLGLVDVKVCAIDQTWSGLKLVYRKDKG